MGITIEQVRNYLGTGAKVVYGCPVDVKNDFTAKLNLKSITHVLHGHPTHVAKLALRPMTDLQKPEFKIDDWRKGAIGYLVETANIPHNSRKSHIGSIMFQDMTFLFEANFDIFGWIDQELAYDVNKLENG